MKQPTLSVIIPAVNAGFTIEDCLSAIFAQTYSGEMDVVIALGPSSDDTLEIVSKLAYSNKQLKVIENPSGLTPTALNLAIEATEGEIISRVDAHSVIPEDYLEQAVSTLLRTKAANVGGIQHPVGFEGTQRIIALAMRSSFGAGPANFRGHGDEGPTDTVYLGTFSRKILEKIGGFDETLIRNQDYELNWRLRQAGYTVWFNPNLKVEYSPRPKLQQLASQYFEYGSWKRRVLFKNPKSLKIRQLAAPTLLIGLFISSLMLITKNWCGLIVPTFYLVTLVFASFAIKESLKFKERIVLLLAFATMHLSWGIGFFFGKTKSKNG